MRMTMYWQASASMSHRSVVAILFLIFFFFFFILRVHQHQVSTWQDRPRSDGGFALSTS